MLFFWGGAIGVGEDLMSAMEIVASQQPEYMLRPSTQGNLFIFGGGEDFLQSLFSNSFLPHLQIMMPYPVSLEFCIPLQGNCTHPLSLPFLHEHNAKKVAFDQKQLQPQQKSLCIGEEAGTHPAVSNHWHVPHHPADSLSAKPISALTSMR